MAFDLGDHIIGHHELSLNSGKSNLSLLWDDLTGNNAFSVTMDVSSAVFDGLEIIDDVNDLDLLKNAKLLKGFGKVLGGIGTAIQLGQLLDFYVGNEHIIDQIVDEKFWLVMKSSTVENLEQKYTLAHLLVSGFIESGEITYEASFGGTLKSVDMSLDDYHIIVGALLELDIAMGESSEFISDVYFLYDDLISRNCE